MSDEKLPVQVVNNPGAERFETRVDGHLAVLQYGRQSGRIVFLHTEVPDELEGRGIGSQLAKAGLQYARVEGLRVVSECPFVSSYIQRHPEYQPLLSTE